MTHTITIGRQIQCDEEGHPTGVFRYRWQCSCEAAGPWRSGGKRSGAHRGAYVSVSTAGLKHANKANAKAGK